MSGFCHMCLKMASEYHEAGLPADLPYGPDLRDGEVGKEPVTTVGRRMP